MNKSLVMIEFDKTRKYLETLRKKLIVMQREL